MTRRRKGGLVCIVAGLVTVAVGVVLKRVWGYRVTMIILHTLATLLFLLPGLMMLCWTDDER